MVLEFLNAIGTILEFLKNQWKEFTKWNGAIDFFRNSYVVY